MPTDADRTSGVLRVLRAPFFLASMVFSMAGAFGFFAVVQVGAWAEDGLRLLGLRQMPEWLPAGLGILGYLGLGVIIPALAAYRWIGWPGAILLPLLVLGIIAKLGNW
ncbi:MAG: hypothetical protein GYB68_03240 [Chloroflexi bacterium]|nr:hypothetical protein [Chloroflexota bacterium]